MRFRILKSSHGAQKGLNNDDKTLKGSKQGNLEQKGLGLSEVGDTIVDRNRGHHDVKRKWGYIRIKTSMLGLVIAHI